MICGFVRIYLRAQFTSFFKWLTGGEHTRTQPPQRRARWVSFNDAPGGKYEPSRLRSQATQGLSRFTYKRNWVCSSGACHIAQMLNGVHFPNDTANLLPSNV
jgi:hypothetical protein